MIKSEDYIQDLIYSLAIFIMPIIGGLAANIYISEKSLKWYKNIKFTMPDIANGGYGVYIGTFIYFFAGLGLVYLGDYYSRKGSANDYNSPFEKTSVSLQTPDFITKRTFKNKNIIDKIILWLIPLFFLLTWISTPIMFQYETLIVPGVLYLVSGVLVLVYLLYILNISWFITVTFLPLFLWLLYNMIFYFVGGSNTGNAAGEVFNNDLI